jgi:hypothetical protein
MTNAEMPVGGIPLGVGYPCPTVETILLSKK